MAGCSAHNRLILQEAYIYRKAVQFMYNVKDYGAMGDGINLDSIAIQKAIDDCAGNGGGTVFIPAGTYVCGTMHLKSHVHILFVKAALILGSKNI